MKLLEFQDLLEYCQIEAIASRVSPTESSLWRGICRSYSKKFNTSLPLVLDLEPEHVILAVYEDRMEELGIGSYDKLEYVMELINKIEDPNYAEKVKKEQDEFDKMILEKEELKMKEREKKKATAKTLSEKKEPLAENLPTRGSIDLSYLEKYNNEG